MYKNKILFRVLLVCICITLAAAGIGALAASANPVLQVNTSASSASIKDGKIQASVAERDVFTYNEILDLSTASKDTQLLNMQFDPTQVGVANATNVKIRFTDVYDADNYITICLNSFTDDWASGHIYMTAGAADQPQIGIENGKPHVNDIYGYGAAVDYSMVGMPKNPEDAYLTLYFDYGEKAIYADRETYTRTKQLVVDLDDPDLYGTNLWEGFTTGQVKMTVFASNYQSATCDFTITTINGNSQFRETDQSAPIISVNTGYAQDAIPAALVGKPYPIFPATAIDGCDGNVDVSSVVYYDEGDGRMTKLSVEDGKFTPAKAGVYVIEYVAKDLSGNTSTANVNVNAIVGDGLQVTLRDAVSETQTGVPVQVISGIDCVAASGHVSYTITAKNADAGDQVEIDPQTHSFTPMADGDWEITVTVRDYICTVVKTFTVNVQPTSQPQVYDTVAIPDYFILGATYQLPTLYGYDFSSGTGVLTAMDVYVTENGSSEKAVANGSYVPANEGAVTVTYRLTVDGKTCEKSYTATVVKTKTVLNTENLSKYFVDPTGAATASSASSKITYSFKKDTKLNFVNFVQVKQLSFGFQVGSQKAYDRISVYLTDIVSGKQVKLSYIKTADGAAFAINDGAAVTLSAAFDAAMSLAFSNDTAIVTPESGKELKVKSFLDGSQFTGFTDSVARFTVELSGVTGSSQFAVQNLNGQKLSSATRDSVAPQFFANAVSGNIEKGETLELKGAFVYDVLNPIATVTLKVTDPDGNAVTDQNGVVLNGTQDATKDAPVLMEKLGTYTILYTAADGKKNTGRHIYTITVTDGEGPTISLLEHTETVQTGDTVTLAGTQVQDNLTANCTVVSYVFDPEGVKIPVTGGTFQATQSGVYTVRYMAFDGDGNCSFASYKVTAKEEKTHYISQSMSLGSDLVLNLWGNVPENYADSLSGTMTYNGTTNNFKLSELTPTAEGLYHMQAEMATAQMTKPVNLTLKHNIIGDVIRRSYTVRDYLVELIEGDYDQATKDLSLELLNMGAWAQKYFDENTGDLANRGYEITPANAINAEESSVTTSGKVSGIHFYGTSVRFLSKAAVRYYFKADGAVDGYTFTIDGVEYDPVEKDGMYYVETPGINPQNMSDVITVQVTDGSSTLSVQYAPIWYFVRTYNHAEDEITKGLMAAAYSYYKEAEAYRQTVTPGQIGQPEAPTGEGVFIHLDVLVTTLSNSNDPVELRFYPHDYTGSVHSSYTDKVTVTAGIKQTIKLDAEKYMVNGVIPEGLGIAVFGGPEWNTTLPDGSNDRHTLTISNVWLKGECERLLDLRTATVTTGTADTGYTDANSGGQASVVDSKIVIEGGYRYDAHKITLSDDPTKNITYLCMDLQVDTLGGNWEKDIELRFYPYDYAGSVHNYYKDNITVKAGTVETVKLRLDRYLVGGELPGIGIGIFGGPAWDAKLPDGYTPDRHTLTVSNMRLEGGRQEVIDLSETTVARGNDGTGYTDANGNGVASVADGKIVISDGFCYDAHKLNFHTVEDPGTTEPEPEPPVEEENTYVVLDMQIDTIGGDWTKDIDMRFYAYGFEGNPHEDYTDSLIFKAGQMQTVKLDAEKYLVDGVLSGIGIGIFGGPEWNTQISDGVYDRHTVTISNVRLEGAEAKEFDLSKITIKSGTVDTGYTVANGSGVGAFADGVYKITNGFCYDCHKLSLTEKTDSGETEQGTYVVLELQLDTVSGTWANDVELRFLAYDYAGNPHTDYTDLVTVKAGEKTTVRLDAEKYLIDGALPGIGIGIFGGPQWNTQISDGVYDRHTLTISAIRLEGAEAKTFDLSKATVASGTDGTGYTGDVFGPGVITIGDQLVLADGFQYFAHKITLG